MSAHVRVAADEATSRTERDPYETCCSCRCTVIPVIGAARLDRVIQGSQTPTADTPVSNSVDTNRASVMQMIPVYVAEPTIDHMSDQLKWWVETDIKREPTARQFLCAPPPTSVPSEHFFIALGLYNLIIARVWLAEKAEKLMFIQTNMMAFKWF